MSTFETIATSANGIDIVHRLERSHFESHASESPYLPALVRAALQESVLMAGYEAVEFDFDEPVGERIIVENEPGDIILYAKRPLRRGLDPFNMNQDPTPTNRVTTVCEYDFEMQCYRLITAYVGNWSPRSPYDRMADPSESIPFWTSHSFARSSTRIVPGTLTYVPPEWAA